MRAEADLMNFRLAVMEDLPQLKAVYKGIIQHMNDNQIPIWDEIYPCELFEEDIKRKRLYLLLNGEEIASAFALCDNSSGENEVEWQNTQAKALYLDRLGVNVRYLREGIGSLALTRAKETARKLGAAYLRLFVVDINKPAINLYIKNGFERAAGIYDEAFADGLVLHEYGYEVKL